MEKKFCPLLKILVHLAGLLSAAGIGSAFGVRSFDKLDSRASHSDVEELKNKLASRASRSDVDELKDKLESADEKYASKSELNELKKSIEKIENNIDFLKENTVRNSDFIRTMTRLETKIDDLKRE